MARTNTLQRRDPTANYSMQRSRGPISNAVLVRVFAGTCIALALCAVVSSKLRKEPRAVWEDDAESSAAYGACKDYMGKRLTTVSDSSFAIHDAVVIRKYVAKRYAIESYVQAYDPFGLPRRSYFFCVVQKQDEDWHLIYLEAS